MTVLTPPRSTAPLELLHCRLLSHSLLALVFIVLLSLIRLTITGWLMVDFAHLCVALLAAAGWFYRERFSNDQLAAGLGVLAFCYAATTILQLGFNSVALPLFLAVAVIMALTLGFTTTLSASIGAIVVFALCGFAFNRTADLPASTSDFASLIYYCAISLAALTYIPVIGTYLKQREALFNEQLAKAKQATHSPKLTQYDPLTGLPVLQVTLDRLRHELDRCKRTDCLGAVMFLDVDDFRAINERHGNPAGDIVLRTLASRIASIVRAADTLSRVGGDEFVAIFADQQDEEQIRLIARKLLAAVNNPVTLSNATIELQVSIGVALFPEHSMAPQELIALADKSAELVKASGGNNYRISSTEL